MQIQLLPAASHNHVPEPTAGICVNWKNHGFSPSLPVLGVISFCTTSKCFLFNVCHRAVCFDTCFPAPLQLRGNGSICHLRTWISLGFFFVSHSRMGEFATGHFFLSPLPGKDTIEQSLPSRGCSHSCHTAIFSFKTQKSKKFVIRAVYFLVKFVCLY